MGKETPEFMRAGEPESGSGPEHQDWNSQAFEDRPLDESDWEIIEALFPPSSNEQRRMIDALREDGNRGVSMSEFSSATCDSVNQKFRKNNLPYKLGSILRGGKKKILAVGR